MVRYFLSLKAELEGVASWKWDDEKQKLLCCSIRHPVDPSDVKDKIVVDFSELEEPVEDTHHHHAVKHHEKPCHFHLTWSDGSKGGIRVLLVNNHMRNNSEAAVSSQEWFPILSLDCENVEPTSFHPLGKEFVVTNHQGNVYKNVDLSSGDWSEYEMSAGSTAITHLESKFE